MEKYKLNSIGGIRYITNNIEEIRTEDNNLNVTEIGYNITIQNKETGDYILCNKNTGNILLMLVDCNEVFKLNFKIDMGKYYIDEREVSKDELHEVFSNISKERQLRSSKIR